MKALPAFLTFLAAFAALSAQAHTELTVSVPADGTTVDASPENLELRFSDPVRLTALTIQKGDTPRQELSPLPSGANAQFAVALPAALGAGRYVVTWRALSADTHVMTGEFSFTVGADAGADAHAGHAVPPAEAPAAAPAAAPAVERHDVHDGAR